MPDPDGILLLLTTVVRFEALRTQMSRAISIRNVERSRGQRRRAAALLLALAGGAFASSCQKSAAENPAAEVAALGSHQSASGRAGHKNFREIRRASCRRNSAAAD